MWSPHIQKQKHIDLRRVHIPTVITRGLLVVLQNGGENATSIVLPAAALVRLLREVYNHQTTIPLKIELPNKSVLSNKVETLHDPTLYPILHWENYLRYLNFAVRPKLGAVASRI